MVALFSQDLSTAEGDIQGQSDNATMRYYKPSQGLKLNMATVSLRSVYDNKIDDKASGKINNEQYLDVFMVIPGSSDRVESRAA